MENNKAIKMVEEIEKRIEKMQELLKIQGQSGNWDANEYMLGMYNGMELMWAVLNDREPEYRTLPNKDIGNELVVNRPTWPDIMPDENCRFKKQCTGNECSIQGVKVCECLDCEIKYCTWQETSKKCPIENGFGEGIIKND